MANHIQRKVQNIHFTNCQFHNNTDGLVIGPDLIYAIDENNKLIIDEDGKAEVAQTFHFENISLTNCSFENHAWNIYLQTDGQNPQQTGSVTNFRIIGCFFQQGKGSFPLPNCGEDSTLTPSCDIRIGGNGCIVGCDFVGSENPDNNLSQIRFNSPWSAATWRVIGNHFKAPPNKAFAIEINGSNPKLSIIGNHFESVTDDNPPPDVVKHPFVFLQNSVPSSHVIHSNIGDGQIYLRTDTPSGKSYHWIDVSPGIPITLGSPTTKGRNVLVPEENDDPLHALANPYYSQVIKFGADLKPKIDGSIGSIHQVDYQVNVTFQWDAGSWWVSKKDNDQFTLNWTNQPTKKDISKGRNKLDWTLHL